MARSPGHRKWPDHQVLERRLDQRLHVSVNGETIADSSNVIQVEEDDHPARLYFPRDDVRMDKLTPSATASTCPFKGQASYYNLKAGGRQFPDAVWSYEDPYDEHAALKDRLAFDARKLPELFIAPAP